jgi:hypothetical protein
VPIVIPIEGESKAVACPKGHAVLWASPRERVEWRTGGSRGAGTPRHPDCSIRTSLVFSAIALTSVAPAYRLRGDRFAGKILAGFLASHLLDGDLAFLRRIHQ